jgi:hypothetical protein
MALGADCKNSFLLERGSTLGCPRRAGLSPELRRVKGASGASGKDMGLPPSAARTLPPLVSVCQDLSQNAGSIDSDVTLAGTIRNFLLATRCYRRSFRRWPGIARRVTGLPPIFP